MRTRFMVAAVCGALAVGCASNGAPDGELTATPTPAQTTAGAGVSPTPSPSASAEAPPEVDLTAEDGDYRRVVEEILRFREWLFAHPHRQDLVSVIYNEDCLCHDGLVRQLQAYVEHERHVEATTELFEFEILEETQLSFRALVSWRAEGDVFEAGQSVESGSGQAVNEEWFLLKDQSGRYRVAGQSGE